MTPLEIFLLAIGLCADSFALAISTGMVHSDYPIKHAIRVGVCFAFFQTLMPILGWQAGIGMKSFIEGIDHWIAFVLLFGIGTKSLIEAICSQPRETKLKKCSTEVLCTMGIATSIDALVVGITFAFVTTSPLPTIITIGIVTFVVSCAGVLFGKRIGLHIGELASILGGIALITIGCKILIQHLFFL